MSFVDVDSVYSFGKLVFPNILLAWFVPREFEFEINIISMAPDTPFYSKKESFDAWSLKGKKSEKKKPLNFRALQKNNERYFYESNAQTSSRGS